MEWIIAILAVIGLCLFLRGWWRWRRKQTGDANELDWLDEIVREHLAGKQDHSEMIRRAISEIERDHDPSPALDRELHRAREALERKPKDEAAN